LCLQGDGGSKLLPGLFPGAGQGDTEMHDMAGQDITPAQLGKLRVRQLHRLERRAGYAQRRHQQTRNEQTTHTFVHRDPPDVLLTSEEIALDETELHEFGIAHGLESINALLGGQRLGWVEQGIETVVTGPDDSKHNSVPALDELFKAVAFVAEYRVAYVDMLFVTTQQHDKMLVVTYTRQDECRNEQVLQERMCYAVATGPQADYLHLAFLVEHGEALGPDEVLIVAGQHAFDD